MALNLLRRSLLPYPLLQLVQPVQRGERTARVHVEQAQLGDHRVLGGDQRQLEPRFRRAAWPRA
jgi:hypothetical protein